MNANLEIFLTLGEHLVLTAAPAVAAALYVARRGMRSVPLIVGVALAASGVTAMLGFWAYYASPTIGEVWGFLLLFGSIEIAVWSWWTGKLDRDLLRQLRTPLALWVLGSLFIVFLGFLHGGADQAISMSASRFSGALPSDNDIPRYFSEWFAANGHNGMPPIYPPDWLMSDRPPLQIGYVLAQHPFSPDTQNLHYEITGVVIQQLWIPAMWAVLCAARLRPTTRALTMFAALVSDVAIVNGFFVWPKLIAATFLLAAVALVISPEWPRWRRDLRVAALFACLLALAMLGHGASLFGVIPLLLIGALRGLPAWRWLGVAALVGLVLLAPWSAYQKYGDPPSNRLLKWQLAGVAEVDERGTLEALEDAYGAVGVDGAIQNKLDNFGEMVGITRVEEITVPAIDALEEGHEGIALGGFRGPRFFSLLPFLGVFLIAPFAMLFARRRGRENQPEWRFAIFCFAFTALSCLIWGLLLFGTEVARTVLHVSSLAMPLLALCGCVAGLRATFPRLAIGVVALNVLMVLVAYTPSLTPPLGSSYSVVAALLAALGLGGFALIAFRERAMDSRSPRPRLALPRVPRRCGARRG